MRFLKYKKIIGIIVLLTSLWPTTSLAQGGIMVDYSQVLRDFQNIIQSVANLLEGVDQSNLQTITQYEKYITQIANKINELEEFKRSHPNLTPEQLQEINAEQDKLTNRYTWAVEGRNNVVTETNQTISQARKDIADNYEGKCNFSSSFSITVCIKEGILSLIYLLVYIMTQVLYLVSQVFNWIIDLTINQFREYAFAKGVRDAWTIMRDMANICFIFILLYIAVNTTLNRGGWEKMIANVIIIALLVNFSAVIPRTIIDVSNMFALQFYNNMVTQKDDNDHPDIGGAMISTARRLMGYRDIPSNTESIETTSKNVNSFIIQGLGVLAIYLTLVFVLVTGSVMLLYRTIALLIIIITAPLAVLAWSLPKYSGKANEWLNKLISESFYAPLFLLFLYIALTVFTKSEFNPESNLASQVIMFILFNAMLMFAIIAAKSMGASGATQAEKWGNRAKGLITGAAAGLGGAAGGAAGVYALGRTAQKLTEKDWYKNADKKWWGRMGKDYLGIDKGLKTIAGSKYGSSQSYSARVEKAAERVTQWKSPEDQLAYMMSLGDTDRKAAWKKLTDRQKSLLQQRVGILDGNDDRRITIDSLVGGMSIEDREKLDKSTAEAEKQKSEAEARQKVADLSSLVNEGKKRRLDEKEPYETDLKGNPDKSRPKFKVDDNKAYIYEDITSTELKRDSSGNLPSNLQLVNRMFDQEDKVGEEAKKKIGDMVKDINVDNIGQVKKFLFKPVTDDKMSPEEKEQAKNMNTKLSEIIVESMEIAQLKKIMQVDKSGLNQEQIDGIARVIDNLPDSDPRKERIRGDSRFASFFKQDKTKEQKIRGPKVEGLMGNNGQPIK